MYKYPFDPRYPVVCMDESPKQLIAETKLPIPARPGQLARYDYEYSWLNMAEIDLRVLSNQCLNCRIDTMTEVRRQVGAWEKERNNKEAVINWRFTTKDARIKLKRLYPSV